jgi:hypothetical protein
MITQVERVTQGPVDNALIERSVIHRSSNGFELVLHSIETIRVRIESGLYYMTDVQVGCASLIPVYLLKKQPRSCESSDSRENSARLN